MLKIKIAETDIEYLDALETEEHYNGSFRRTLTVTCMPDAIGVDALNALMTEENLASVTLVNTETNASAIHEGYVLKLKVGIENKLVQAETTDTPAIYEDRLVFKMGKRTYIEQKLHELGL